MKDFYIVIERDQDGFHVGEVLQLRACYSQGRTIDELLHNIREVIALCLDDPSEQICPLKTWRGCYRDKVSRTLSIWA